MKAVIVAAVRGIAATVAVLIQVLIMLMLGILALQVFMRSVLNAPPSWSEEAALLGFTWVVLLGVAHGVREGIHVRMDLLLDAVPALGRRVMEKAISASTIVIGSFLLVAGWDYMLNTRDATSAAIGYPMPVLYLSAVVSGLLIVVFGLERLLLQEVTQAGEEVPE